MEDSSQRKQLLENAQNYLLNYPNKLPETLRYLTQALTVSSRFLPLPSGHKSASKRGGTPNACDLGFWPEHGQVPMLFLGQISLSQLAQEAPQELLPDEGYLYFFVDAGYFQKGGNSPSVPCKVFYQNTETISETIQTPQGASLLPESYFGLGYHISIAQNDSLEWELLRQLFALSGITEENYFRRLESHPQARCEDDGLRLDGLLGFPCISGTKAAILDYDDFYLESAAEFPAKFAKALSQKILFEWHTADGTVCVLIHEEDLKKMDFDRAWAIYQGS